MLAHPKLFENELKQIAAVTIDEKYKYYHGGYLSLPTIDDDEWNKIQRVCLYKDKVIGYFNANVNRTHGIISNLAIFSVAASYKEFKCFEKDLLSFFLLLLKSYPTILWTVVYDNPVRKKYEQFCRAVGGHIVGVYKQSCRIGKTLMDEEALQIISTDETIEKVQELIDRIHM